MASATQVASLRHYARGGSRDVREGNAPPAHIYLATSRDGGRTYDKATIFTGPTPTSTSDWTWVPEGHVDHRAEGDEGAVRPLGGEVPIASA